MDLGGFEGKRGFDLVDTILSKTNRESKPLVLIVDDISDNLQVLGNLLKELNCRIAFATGGRQALSMLDDLTPDLILLDILMPDINGLDVCRQLKAKESSKHIPVIFLTAKDDQEDIVQGLRAGAVDYVTKPFNADELRARVSTHLELKLFRDKQQRLIQELREALDEVKNLSGLLPICSYCKKIRNDDGYWQKVEQYLSAHSSAQFSHSICPECLEKHFPPEEDE